MNQDIDIFRESLKQTLMAVNDFQYAIEEKSKEAKSKEGHWNTLLENGTLDEIRDFVIRHRAYLVNSRRSLAESLGVGERTIYRYLEDIDGA